MKIKKKIVAIQEVFLFVKSLTVTLGCEQLGEICNGLNLCLSWRIIFISKHTHSITVVLHLLVSPQKNTFISHEARRTVMQVFFMCTFADINHAHSILVLCWGNPKASEKSCLRRLHEETVEPPVWKVTGRGFTPLCLNFVLLHDGTKNFLLYTPVLWK